MRTIVLLPVLGFACLQGVGFIGYAGAIVYTCARACAQGRPLPLAPALVVATVALLFGSASLYAAKKLVGGLRGSRMPRRRIAAAIAFGPVTVTLLTLLDALTIR